MKALVDAALADNVADTVAVAVVAIAIAVAVAIAIAVLLLVHAAAVAVAARCRGTNSLANPLLWDTKLQGNVSEAASPLATN